MPPLTDNPETPRAVMRTAAMGAPTLTLELRLQRAAALQKMLDTQSKRFLDTSSDARIPDGAGPAGHGVM